MKILGKYPSVRLRRNRKYNWSRRLVAENNLTVDDLILPIFVREGKSKVDNVKSMPGCNRYTIDKLNNVINTASKLRIPLVAIFPNTPGMKKNSIGSEALNEDNLVCRAIKKIKKINPNIGVMADVALDPYTDHGHDGILINNEVANDETVEVLIEQSILLAEAGADIIAPSDMMDGRIGLIRDSLEKQNLKDTILLSYAAKYNSKFYGPFRDAVNSASNLGNSSKSPYQMNISNKNEALHEVALDINEGADIVMVKPAMPYLDVIQSIKKEFKVPTFAYQVSGEFSMLKNAINHGWLDKEVMLESLVSIKRAGADAILSYAAKEISKEINKV